MAYSKNRNSYPRICELIVQGLAKVTRKKLEERIEGDDRFEYDCGEEEAATALRYAIYGWVSLLETKGTEEEKEVADLARRWKLSTSGSKLVCVERENLAQLRSVMQQLMEKGML